MFMFLIILGWLMVAISVILYIKTIFNWFNDEFQINKISLVIAAALLLGSLIPMISAYSGNDEASDGQRTGVVTQFSYTGMPWKAYEGELVMGGVGTGTRGGTIANVWNFSVDNYRLREENRDEIVRLLSEACETGQKVEIKYVQEMAVAKWRARNNYLVQSVRIIEKGEN